MMIVPQVVEVVLYFSAAFFWLVHSIMKIMTSPDQVLFRRHNPDDTVVSIARAWGGLLCLLNLGAVCVKWNKTIYYE